MLAVGYYKSKEGYVIIVRNSWGKRFADRGYVHIPLSMLLDPFTCFDFWTLRTSEDETPKPVDPPPTPKRYEEPVQPQEPKEPFWKNQNFYFLIGFGVLLMLFVLLK